MVGVFVRVNDSTGGVMTLTDKTKFKFGFRITLCHWQMMHIHCS